MFSTKIQVHWGEFSVFSLRPMSRRSVNDRTKERFVNQDNVLIERLIFDLGLRC